ncbi:MAG: hypothetical protein HRF50_04380 [Phycisphaerae bacterium]|jgi:hypothetical protein
MSAKLTTSDLARQETAVMPPWMAAMRKAAMGAISEQDVQAIVRAQIEAAKQGDRHAIKFVFDYILGGNTMKGGTFVQNNFYGRPDDDPAAPTDQVPGTNGKLRTMQRRKEAGLPLCDPRDRANVNLD